MLVSICVIQLTAGGKVAPELLVKISFRLYAVDSVRPVKVAVRVPTATVGSTIDSEEGEIVKEYDVAPVSPAQVIVAELFVIPLRLMEVGGKGIV